MSKWLVSPGEPLSLDRHPPDLTPGAPGDEKSTTAALDDLRKRIASLQERLWAEGTRSLLVVLQGIDTSGKDSTIRNVFYGTNHLGIHITPFKVPTPVELAHDFLWRVHRQAPAHGDIAIFNRSHYEDVLTVRVRRLVAESVWRERFDLINNFERQLAHGGTTIVKFFLHLSKQEQARRLQSRITDPTKRWKFHPGDLEDRRHWDEYQTAYEQAITLTSTEWGPWYVIPADTRWYRNWAVASVVAGTLEQMDPQYPERPDIDPATKIE